MIDLLGGHPETDALGDAAVQLLDTTLRGDKQAPGVSLTPEEKPRVARGLDAAGIDIIKTGSACTGSGERAAIDRVPDLDLDATVTSFCRGLERDIDLAVACGVDAISLVVPASDKQIRIKIGISREKHIQTTATLVEYANNHDLWVEVIGEDGSRADIDYLEELMTVSVAAGADRICYVDTVGHATPDHTFECVSRLADLGPTSTLTTTSGPR